MQIIPKIDSAMKGGLSHRPEKIQIQEFEPFINFIDQADLFRQGVDDADAAIGDSFMAAVKYIMDIWNRKAWADLGLPNFFSGSACRFFSCDFSAFWR
jgi:hypothetical protein